MNTFNSVNPARPNEVVGSYPLSGPDDVSKAVDAAAEAQVRWAKTPIPARAQYIAAAADAIARRKEELAQAVSVEAGKIAIEAGGDVQEAVDMGRFIAGSGRAALGSVHPCELPNKMGFTTRQPVGVVGMITPWNFPVAIPSWKCFPALLGGNGIVIKPSEHAPKCCELFVECLIEAGIPADLVNIVHGNGVAGAAIATHPLVRAVSFTGSVGTGRKVAAAAMESGPRLVSLELGGKNAMIVADDADLELACDGAVFGAFGTAGQRCTSTSRLILQPGAAKLVDSIVQRARALRLGDPTDATTDVGPVIDRASVLRIHEMVGRAIDEGAEVATGGEIIEVDGCEGGAFYSPTVLVGVKPDSFIAKNEVFGPVLAVIECNTLDEAVDTVNLVDYGLSAAIYTRDVSAALRAVDAINTGIVYVNAPTIGAEIQLPFGGTKHTGNGFREAGVRGIEQFTEIKSVYIDYSGRLQRAQIDT